jgi:hypothetical protein
VVLIRAITVLGLASVLIVGACASPPRPSESIHSTPPASVRPAGASPGDSPSVAVTYPIVTIDQEKISTVTLVPGFQAHRLAASGPLVVFDQIGYGGDAGQGRSILLADLEHQTLETIATARGKDAAWVPDINGQTVVWTEWLYKDETQGTGSLTWRLMSMNLRTHKASEFASGVNRRLEGPSAVPPLVRVDGDRIAYTEEDPAPGRELGWKIIVRSLSSGRVEQTYPTDLSIYSMAMSGPDVVYSEGLVDNDQSFKYKTRLMLATPGTPQGSKIADDAFEVAFRGDRFAWVADPASSQNQVGMAQHPQVFTAAIDSPEPQPASLPAGPRIRGSVWPTTGDGLVGWSDDEETDVPASPNRLTLWSPTMGAYVVEPAHSIVPMLGDEGWLTWYDDSSPDINVVLHGLRLTALTR